jgi:hypothetical protein
MSDATGPAPSADLRRIMSSLDALSSKILSGDKSDCAGKKAVVQEQIRELSAELGAHQAPRTARVDHYFELLLLDSGPFPPHDRLVTHAAGVGGSLGRLRDHLGLKFTEDYVNTVADEQDVNNFRLLVDYVTSLAQLWISVRGKSHHAH